MKNYFDSVSYECSKLVTQRYSTSFTLGTKMLASKHRNIYITFMDSLGFADEIVDSFHDFNKKDSLNRFVEDLKHA